MITEILFCECESDHPLPIHSPSQGDTHSDDDSLRRMRSYHPAVLVVVSLE